MLNPQSPITLLREKEKNAWNPEPAHPDEAMQKP